MVAAGVLPLVRSSPCWRARSVISRAVNGVFACARPPPQPEETSRCQRICRCCRLPGPPSLGFGVATGASVLPAAPPAVARHPKRGVALGRALFRSARSRSGGLGAPCLSSRPRRLPMCPMPTLAIVPSCTPTTQAEPGLAEMACELADMPSVVSDANSSTNRQNAPGSRSNMRACGRPV